MRHARVMFRRSQVEIPIDLRERLEAARLDLLALFRALDRMHLAPQQIPQRLIRQLFELDADYVEALWGLDQPPGKLNPRAMLRDTLAALEQLPVACSRFRKALPSQAQPTLSQLELTVRVTLSPTEAYNMIPGRDPRWATSGPRKRGSHSSPQKWANAVVKRVAWCAWICVRTVAPTHGQGESLLQRHSLAAAQESLESQQR
jgi:hypothetical protein